MRCRDYEELHWGIEEFNVEDPSKIIVVLEGPQDDKDLWDNPLIQSCARGAAT